ncbi:MAG: hypothetical protein ABL917_03600 [Parcubacteria group bacterium]
MNYLIPSVLVVFFSFSMGVLSAISQNKFDLDSVSDELNVEMSDSELIHLENIWNRFDRLGDKEVVRPDSLPAEACLFVEIFTEYTALAQEYYRASFEETRLEDLIAKKVVDAGKLASHTGYEVVKTGQRFNCYGKSESWVVDQISDLSRVYEEDVDLDVLRTVYLNSVRLELLYVVTVENNPEVGRDEVAKKLGLPVDSPLPSIELLLRTAIEKWDIAPADLGFDEGDRGEGVPPVFLIK